MKKTKLLIAPLLVVPFLASCGGGSEEYKVSIPDTNGVIVTPNKATKGKEYVGTIKMAQDVDPDHILPDALDKVTSGNKELVATKDYTYTLKEDNLSADFKIPAANIVGDVSIQLTLKDKLDPTVNAEEYEAALAMTGVEYLQIDSSMNAPGTMVGEESEIISPSTYYIVDDMEEFPGIGTFYDEIYAYELSATNHKYIERDNSATPWEGMEWDTLAEDRWITPQKRGEQVKLGLAVAGITGLESFTYDPTSKSYVNTTAQGLDIVLKFEDKKLVSMDMTGSMVSTFAYEEITPELPIPAPTL